MLTTAAAPSVAWAKGTMEQTMTGKNMSTPLQPGPSQCAASVTAKTSVAPQAICTGTRTWADMAWPCFAPTTTLGRHSSTRAGAREDNATAHRGVNGMCNTAQPPPKNPHRATGKATNQGRPTAASQG